eukprot:5415312-Prymnesium_polylepis.1
MKAEQAAAAPTDDDLPPSSAGHGALERARAQRSSATSASPSGDAVPCAVSNATSSAEVCDSTPRGNAGAPSAAHLQTNCRTTSFRRPSKDLPTLPDLAAPLSTSSGALVAGPQTALAQAARSLEPTPEDRALRSLVAVSYTHLTLPTICSV